MTNSVGHIAKGTLLVAGTAIGGGMLALPVLTSPAGFFPSIAIFIACWLFMAATGLLFLEICLWMNGETNIISMAEKTLGKFGKYTAWFVYLLLFYCLTLAYIVGCGNLFAEMSNGHLTHWQGSLLFVLLFAPFVYIGSSAVGRINFALMIALIVAFLGFVAIGFPYVDKQLLHRSDWMLSFVAMPVAFTSFAYQGIIPTLTSYMRFHTGHIRLAILLGTFIPFVTYVVWEWLILGMIPFHGSGGLAEALVNGNTAVHPLKTISQHPYVYFIGQCFAFLAMVTSFLGVTLGLLDFFADGLKIEKKPLSKFLLCLLVFLPPLIFAFTHAHVFLQALDFAGGYGCAILLGVLPIAMVWVGRYHLGYKAEYRLFGGRIVLSLMACFVLFELFR